MNHFLKKWDLKIKKICFGKLSEELSNIYIDYKNYDLKECVLYALNNVKDNDVILFSCGCSSFDCFSNYKERGKVFNEIIKEKDS